METDRGTRIDAWKPHDNVTYWCHGYTFGGSSAPNGPFSIWGNEVPIVLRDDGWVPTFSCLSASDDILVFARNNVAHSGIIYSYYNKPNEVSPDENRSRLDSKWGAQSQNKKSWAKNAAQYGPYRVFSKYEKQGPCQGLGENELPWS